MFCVFCVPKEQFLAPHQALLKEKLNGKDGCRNYNINLNLDSYF